MGAIVRIEQFVMGKGEKVKTQVTSGYTIQEKELRYHFHVKFYVGGGLRTPTAALNPSRRLPYSVLRNSYRDLGWWSAFHLGSFLMTSIAKCVSTIRTCQGHR
jgi:hypothetical protein